MQAASQSLPTPHGLRTETAPYIHQSTKQLCASIPKMTAMPKCRHKKRSGVRRESFGGGGSVLLLRSRLRALPAALDSTASSGNVVVACQRIPTMNAMSGESSVRSSRRRTPQEETRARRSPSTRPKHQGRKQAYREARMMGLAMRSQHEIRQKLRRGARKRKG